MRITQRIASAVNGFRQPNVAKNAMGKDLAKKFMKYGNGSAPMVQDWSQVLMDDQSNYTGFMYSAINNRGNSVAQLAEGNLFTDADQGLLDAASKAEETLLHPYLIKIDESDSFSNYKFWYGISAFLDLAGVYYLMAIRGAGTLANGDKYASPIKEFKLLNPFDIKRVVNKDTGEFGGYAEQRDGKYRVIPADMIIEIKKFNPFSWTEPYSTAEAAKDAQFTLKQSSDFARHAIQKNINSPGIVTIGDSDLMVSQEDFKNFKSRILGHEKGEPIFGMGSGALQWNAMQIDLDKAALPDISEINLNALIAVTGNSKTMFGIEQSGVTRDTAKIQKDLFVANHIMPQLQLIIDALNMDYQRNYPEEYAVNKFRIKIDSPLKTDRDAELKDSEIKTANIELYTSLISKGYDPEIAAKFVEGKIDLETLSDAAPDPEEVPPVDEGKDKDDKDKKDDSKTDDDADKDEKEENARTSKKNLQVVENPKKVIKKNAAEEDRAGIIQQQQASLQNAVVNLEAEMVATAIRRIQAKQAKATNAEGDDPENLSFADDELITKAEQREFQKDLAIVLAAFYGIVFLLWTPKVANDRLKEFQRTGTFKLDAVAKQKIKEIAKKSSTSHVKTVNDTILKEVRKQAATGASQQQIISKITEKYANEISETRAKAIARTETNRAFTMSQYEYDRQFIAQNKDWLKAEGKKAYKQWLVRSDNPCSFCLSLQARGAIPFDEPFADIGDTLSVTSEDEKGNSKVQKLVVSFDTPQAGNLHVNCGCGYTLIFK